MKREIKYPPSSAGLYEMWYGDKVYVGESNVIQWRAYNPNHPTRKLRGEPDYIIFNLMPNSTKEERIEAENKRMIELGKEICLNAMFANKMSKKTKQKISKANKGKPSHNKNKKMSKESNKKRSNSLKGHKISQETRNKISKSLRKRNEKT